MNPLYQQLMGGGMQSVQQPSRAPTGFGGIRFQNPIQKMNYLMEAIRNPAAFVKRNIPSIPDEILNDSNQVLQYMRQNLGVTERDIQNAANQMPRF